MEPYRYREGSSPLLVSIPHAGTHIPQALLAHMAPAARRLDDTDWHVDRLYDFLDELDASVLVATHSRYVVDLNRPPDDAPLYPGQDTIGLVPLETAAREPLYAPGAAPTAQEIAARVEKYWKPYHARLAEALAAIRARHGYALLWDAHSIASRLPRFFEGKLPDFNLGTAHGASCGAGIGEALLAVAKRTKGFSAVLNGRFIGGYITRHYGRPAEGVHAVQLELAQCTYMEELRPPYRFREDLARRVRPRLRALMEEFLRRARALHRG
ncbi:MAG: N-formylglutamate deformylase [Pseudomonadota bacterium]|jgi:N-formylglutamate deformylase